MNASAYKTNNTLCISYNALSTTYAFFSRSKKTEVDRAATEEEEEVIEAIWDEWIDITAPEVRWMAEVKIKIKFYWMFLLLNSFSHCRKKFFEHGHWCAAARNGAHLSS